MDKVCPTGIIDIHGNCVQKIGGIPKSLLPLVAEARKYPTAEAFSKAFSVDVMHGRYFHITDDPKFKIQEIVPTDATNMGAEGGDPGLMVSSDPQCWKNGYCQHRGYIAEIDLSQAVPDVDYTIVNRGFGQEVFIKNLKAVSVKHVKPIKKGIAEVNRYDRLIDDLVGTERKAKIFWRKAKI